MATARSIPNLRCAPDGCAQEMDQIAVVEPLEIREGIGWHNAVDKVVGHAQLHEVDLTHTFLMVSGRVSFETLQKALAARIPAIAAISAPSSLAVDFAKSSGQTLVSFLRPPTFNRYA